MISNIPLPIHFLYFLLIKVSFSCTPPSAAPTASYRQVSISSFRGHSPASYSPQYSGNIRTFSNQFLSGVPQMDNQIEDGQNQQIWGPNWFDNGAPGEDRGAIGEPMPTLKLMNGGNIPEGQGISTIQWQMPNEEPQNNDLQLLEPTSTLASMSTIRHPHSPLNSLQITPVNIDEEEQTRKMPMANLSTIPYKNDVPIPKIPQLDLDSSKSAIPLFVPLECTQNGPKNYGELLNCLEVEVKPFDGFSFVQGEFPIPIPQQICNFDDENPDEKCSFYSTENEALQFNLGRFHGGKNNFGDAFGQLMRRPNGEMPNGHFLVLIEPEGREPTNSGILKLDIACQRGNGQLSFGYWCTFGQFSLKVCTRMGEERHCTLQIEYSADSSRVEIEVVNPAKNGADRFEIEIIATGFYEPSILILDNLIYQANSCDGENGGKNERERGKIAEAKIFAPRAEAIPLEGENGREELELYSKPILPPNFKRIEVKPSRIKMESEENEGGIEEEIRSKFWPSLAYPMARKVIFEKDAKIQREMLKLMHFGGKKIGKEEKKRAKMESTKRRMGPWGEDGEKVEREGNGGGREIYNRIDALRKLQKLRLAANRRERRPLEVCELVECKFSRKDFCHYSQVENGGKFRFGKWKIARPKPRNINIKSRKAQKMMGKSGENNGPKYFGYAFVGSENWESKEFGAKNEGEKAGSGFGRKIYILQSEELKLGENKTGELNFDILRRKNAFSFQICLNSILNCVYRAPDEGGGQWRRGERVEMPAETKRLFIMATQIGEGNGGMVAIDNIHLKIDGKPCKIE